MGITAYGCRGILASMLADTPMSNMLMKLAFRFNSDLPAGKSEDLSFLGAIGVLKEWTNGRNVVRPKEYDFSLKNRKFSHGVDIPLDWLNGDKTGMIRNRMSDVVGRTQQFWSKLMATLINNAGTSTKTLDGVAFFHDTHVRYSAFDNLLSFTAASGTAPTPLEAANAIWYAYTQMLTFLDDQGEPANEGLSSLTISCGTDIGAAISQAISQQTLDTGSGTVDNPLKGLQAAGVKVDAIVSPRITTTAKMQVWNTSPGAKPLLAQENTGEGKIDVKNETSEYAIDNDAVQVLVKLVGEAGYGRPWEAAQVEFT
jgi:phage major head subunit gpT-like protein